MSDIHGELIRDLQDRLEQANQALWDLWHYDGAVEEFLAERHPRINEKIIAAREGQ